MMDGEKRQKISFAEFELDSTNRVLRRAGETLALNAKTFDLLEFFVEKNNRLVSKNEILEAVWEGQFVEESNLSVQVSALRKILGEKKSEPRFLITVPGKGYKFVGEIEHDSGEIVIEKHRISRLIIEEEKTGREGEEETGKRGEEEKPNVPNVRSLSPLLLFSFSSLIIILVVGGYWFFNNPNRSNRTGDFPVSAAEKQPQIRRLTNSGRVNMAVLSPDGKFYAYSFYEIGSYRTELRIGQTDGSSDRALLPIADAVNNPIAFSADGSSLYYVESEPRRRVGTLYKVPVLGGVSQKILGGIGIYLAISPDEKQIAFIRSDQTQQKSAIILVNADGSDERELVARPLEQPFEHFSLAWSPDASQIAFAAATETGGSYEIYTAATKDGSVAPLTAHQWIEIARLEWLKDQSGLLTVARNRETAALTQVWQIDYPSGTANRVVRDLAKYGSVLSLSADSNAFIVTQVNAESNIWVAPAGNLKEAKQITFGTLGRQDGWRGLDWTTGGRIVYAAQSNQSFTLWTMNADGKNSRQITPLGFQDKTPTASADGTFVVFESDRSGKSEIWRVRIDGSDLRRITDSGGNSNPSLTPDGEWLVYRHLDGADGAIYRVPLAGGAPERLTFQNSFAPRVSPDGKTIACGYAADGKIKLAVIASSGGEPLKLFDVPPTYNFDIASIRWSADGKYVSYRDWANGIWTQSLAGGAPKLLEDLPKEKFYPFAWSPDGKQFAFTRGREVRDAVLINDYRR